MFTNSLNEPQREAVLHGQGPLLVLAGAGSGKTGVITRRIGNLIAKQNVPAHSICAVTFTNKAATEMKERLKALAPGKTRGIFVGTYHSLGLRLIRENPDLTWFTGNFSILGKDDQLAIAAEIQREFKIDPDQIPDTMMVALFSRAKNSGVSYAEIPRKLDQDYGPFWGDWFIRYQEILKNWNSADFDDLILIPREFLSTHAEVREKYRKKWQFILADEFQDTNPLQFEFLNYLLNENRNLCAVGDDDQSIYAWRGADPGIILNYKKYFPDSKIIFLEQNYRSRQYILELANMAISANTDRHVKNLWSAREGGGKAKLFTANDPTHEAEFTADQIQILRNREQISFGEMAILYRTNFQSRSFEETLRVRNIPYYVSGGYQFFDRKEIKDFIAYLRFMANQGDERSLMRILNVPRRNISDSQAEKLKNYVHLAGMRLWDLILEIEGCEISLQPSALSGLLEFRDFINKFESDIRRPGNFTRTVMRMLEELDFEREFIRQNLDANKIQGKIFNLRELINSISSFENDAKPLPGLPEDSGRGLYQYLQYIALMTADDETATEKNKDKVQLMTIHQAKGLEFQVVFLTGLEEGILPHKRSLEENEDETTSNEKSVEEERRLLYVGITRAKDILYLTHCSQRKNYGTETVCEPSRFLSELPPELLDNEETMVSQAEESIEILKKNLEALVKGFSQ